MERTLIWRENGYHLQEFLNWRHYKATTSSSFLAHDLFHHRPIDKGTWMDEFRALGAASVYDFAFTPQRWKSPIEPSYGALNSVYLNVKKRKGFPTPSESFNPLAAPTGAIEMFQRMFEDDYLAPLAVWCEGREHGENTNVKAYEIVTNSKFITDFHVRFSNQNVLVNTSTGKIKVLDKSTSIC